MADVQSYSWKGITGQLYAYWIYQIGTTFNDEQPGNYIFAYQKNGSWIASYIGQTENLHDRLTDHEKESCAKRHGATHIHAHLTSGGESVRKAEEKDLIQLHNPPCNKQFT